MILDKDYELFSESNCLTDADAVIFDPNSLFGDQGFRVLGLLRTLSSTGASIWIPKYGYDALFECGVFQSSRERSAASKVIKAFTDLLSEGLPGIQLLENFDLFQIIRSSASEEFRYRNTVLITQNEALAYWYLCLEEIASPSVLFCRNGEVYDIAGEAALHFREYRKCKELGEGESFEFQGGGLLGSRGRSVCVVDEPFGYGSEAEVYEVQGEDCVAKIYTHQLTELEIDKLMLISSIDVDFLAKPLEILAKTHRLSRDVVGFTMDDCRSMRSMSSIFVGGTLDSFRSVRQSVTRADAVSVAIELVLKAKRLHFDGVLIGDFGLSNFLLDPKTLEVKFIDVAGFNVAMISNRVIANEDFPLSFDYSDYRDCVSAEYAHLAIAVFKIVTLGISPFLPPIGNEPARFIFSEECRNFAALFIWRSLPDFIQDLFTKVFVDFKLVDEDEMVSKLLDYSRILKHGTSSRRN